MFGLDCGCKGRSLLDQRLTEMKHTQNKTRMTRMTRIHTDKLICFLALALLLAGCRAPAITITPYQPTALILPTRTPITLPTRLPTLTRQPTQMPTTTFTPLPTSTAVPTYPTNTPALTAESSEAITITPTLDALSLYERSTALCQAAFEPGAVLTTTQPGTHLPTFVLRNRPYDDVYWEALTG